MEAICIFTGSKLPTQVGYSLKYKFLLLQTVTVTDFHCMLLCMQKRPYNELKQTELTPGNKGISSGVSSVHIVSSIEICKMAQVMHNNVNEVNSAALNQKKGGSKFSA